MAELSYGGWNMKRATLVEPQVKTHNCFVSPLDFSFCQLTEISDIYTEEPRHPRRQHTSGKDEQIVKSRSKCLRLNNNSLSSIDSLVDILNHLFKKPKELAWLDLSFNELPTISPSLKDLENLQILYLHGNRIVDFDGFGNLSALKHLRKLTLHGNPVETNKEYRWKVLSMFPNLQEFDFSFITKGDKLTAETWRRVNVAKCTKKKPKKTT